jgi:hypothetical protein
MGDSGEFSEIKTLIASLYERIQLVGRTNDPSAALDPAAADEAAHLWEIVNSANDVSPLDRLNSMRSMAFLHWFRYQSLPEELGANDLARAIEIFRDLTKTPKDLIPAGYPLVPDDIERIFNASVDQPRDHVEQLSGEAARAYYEFKQGGHPAILGLTISLVRNLIDATPENDPMLPAYLTTLGGYLAMRYEINGDSADLDASIEASIHASSMTPPDEPESVYTLTNMGNALAVRYEREGDRSDLETAIEAGELALRLTSIKDSHTRFGTLSSLAANLQRRYELDGERADLDTAIRMGRQALAVSSPDFFYRFSAMANLATSLSSLYAISQDRSDLDEAIHFSRLALDGTPLKHSYRPMHLTNLGTSLLRRFSLTGDHADLDAAIDAQQQAKEMIPANHPSSTIILASLARARATRLSHENNASDLATVLNYFKQATQVPSGVPTALFKTPGDREEEKRTGGIKRVLVC